MKSTSTNDYYTYHKTKASFVKGDFCRLKVLLTVTPQWLNQLSFNYLNVPSLYQS